MRHIVTEFRAHYLVNFGIEEQTPIAIAKKYENN